MKNVVLKTVLADPNLLLVRPPINRFMLRYLKKFSAINIGTNLILHSHLPPLNSKAYSRFVDVHLRKGTQGPSHAQIGLTNACPQNCEYCYNKDRKGEIMETNTIIEVIQDLKREGVVWLGFTGGEPLLNDDIVRITESAGEDIAVKMFTTGSALTEELASDLRMAGMFSVSVSLDHWREEEHDRVRRCKGAFRTALEAIEIFKRIDGLHVGVSAVISKEMLSHNEVEELLEFLIELEVHEAWLSETKPSVLAFWTDDQLFSEDDRLGMMEIQDRYNKQGKITVNYLGHFEGRENFGCNAGHKMVYVDAFGEVSPCVFTPMTFGNVREKPVSQIFHEMSRYFQSSDCCFINNNYKLFRDRFSQDVELTKETSLEIMSNVCFGELPEFFRIYYR